MMVDSTSVVRCYSTSHDGVTLARVARLRLSPALSYAATVARHVDCGWCGGGSTASSIDLSGAVAPRGLGEGAQNTGGTLSIRSTLTVSTARAAYPRMASGMLAVIIVFFFVSACSAPQERQLLELCCTDDTRLFSKSGRSPCGRNRAASHFSITRAACETHAQRPGTWGGP
jgi:hypothetical protein